MQDTEFGKLERLPAYRAVYDAIEGQILSGRLRVGDPLPPEVQLAGQFGVNRSTVREGIRLLEQSGLVERDGGKRPRISTPHFLDLASSASRRPHPAFGHVPRELWNAAMIVEPAIAELAALQYFQRDVGRGGGEHRQRWKPPWRRSSPAVEPANVDAPSSGSTATFTRSSRAQPATACLRWPTSR